MKTFVALLLCFTSLTAEATDKKKKLKDVAPAPKTYTAVVPTDPSSIRQIQIRLGHAKGSTQTLIVYSVQDCISLIDADGGAAPYQPNCTTVQGTMNPTDSDIAPFLQDALNTWAASVTK